MCQCMKYNSQIMADITMCSGEGCEMKEKCYRFKASPNPYMQSYFASPPINEDGECVKLLIKKA